MKKILPVIFSVLITGCTLDEDSLDELTGNSLDGTWVSSCFEMVDLSDDSFISYAIDTYVFEGNSYTLESVSYEDDLCSEPSGSADSYFGDYSIGDKLIGTDGAMIARISMTRQSPDWPEGLDPEEIEGVYRISGSELNFGFYDENDIPEINYGWTLTKQAD
ncbi:MAG: hypothetical protein JKY01_09820 [Pseudomonadales bacterium]|nr:hypothetical protein [Pseudomonadales bacterium]